jgi:hypothetical protein
MEMTRQFISTIYKCNPFNKLCLIMHAHIVSEIRHNESNKIIFCMQTNCRPYLRQISNQLSRTDVARALFGKKKTKSKKKH